jgi:hypothetical protein
MTSEQLASQVESVIRSIRERILGTGQRQYDRGAEQLIETKTGRELLVDTLEELDDAIVYLAHLRARVNLLIERELF